MATKVRILEGTTAQELADKMNADTGDRFASQITIAPDGKLVAFIFYEEKGERKREFMEDGKLATENQIWYMKKNNLKIPMNCTRMQAHDIISTHKDGKI